MERYVTIVMVFLFVIAGLSVCECSPAVVQGAKTGIVVARGLLDFVETLLNEVDEKNEARPAQPEGLKAFGESAWDETNGLAGHVELLRDEYLEAVDKGDQEKANTLKLELESAADQLKEKLNNLP